MIVVNGKSLHSFLVDFFDNDFFKGKKAVVLYNGFLRQATVKKPSCLKLPLTFEYRQEEKARGKTLLHLFHPLCES